MLVGNFVVWLSARSPLRYEHGYVFMATSYEVIDNDVNTTTGKHLPIAVSAERREIM